MKVLFPELNGFIIYEEELLTEYIRENKLIGNNILEYFVETQHGEKITQQGIAIPIIGVHANYYKFNVLFDKSLSVFSEEDRKVESRGWVFNSKSGKVSIVGVGYFMSFDSINENNSLVYEVNRGLYTVDIICGAKENQEDYLIELIFEEQTTPPEFKGVLDTDYYFSEYD